MIIILQNGEQISNVFMGDGIIITREDMHEYVDSCGRVILQCVDCGTLPCGTLSLISKTAGL